MCRKLSDIAAISAAPVRQPVHTARSALCSKARICRVSSCTGAVTMRAYSRSTIDAITALHSSVIAMHSTIWLRRCAYSSSSRLTQTTRQSPSSVSSAA